MCIRDRLTTFCYGSGAQGGIFLPMLVIGAATGAFCESLLSTLGLISPDFVPQFVICAMGGMLAAAMRTPISVSYTHLDGQVYQIQPGTNEFNMFMAAWKEVYGTTFEFPAL